MKAAAVVAAVVASASARPGVLHPTVHERVEREHLSRRPHVVIEHHAQLRREQTLATRLCSTNVRPVAQRTQGFVRGEG